MWALSLCFFVFGTGEYVGSGLLLEVSDDLGVSASSAGRLFSAYAAGVVVGAFLVPVVTRRLRPKTALCALMALLVLGDVLCALAVDFPMLVACRFATGLAQAAFFGLASTLAADAVGADRRAAAIAAIFTGLTSSILVGVPAGTALGQRLGWRVTFATVAVLGAVTLVALLALVPSSARGSATRTLRSEVSALRRPRLLLAFGTTALVQGSIAAVYTYVSPILVDVAGFDSADVGAVLILFGMGAVLGNWGGGRLADRRLLPALIGVTTALAGVFVVLAGLGGNRPAMAAWVLAFGIAAFSVVPGLQLRVVDVAGEHRDIASTVNIAAFNMGNAAGSLVGGIVIDSRLGLPGLPWASAGLATCGIAALLVARHCAVPTAGVGRGRNQV